MTEKTMQRQSPDDKIADLPVISIIVPVKPGGGVKALEAISKLDYPPGKVEVFIAEGCQPSKQRNEAVRASRGDILYFLDDDSMPLGGNLLRIARHYKNPKVAAVGGPSLTPGSDTFIQQCFSSVFTSPFGGAGIRNRYRKAGTVRETTEKELILCNLSFRANVFKELGGLDERLYPNEENELMIRMQKKGYKLIHDPGLAIDRSQRKTVSAFILQLTNYGRGRMEQTLLDMSTLQISHMAPLFFLVYLVSQFFFPSSLYRIPLIIYVILTISFSLGEAFRSDFNTYIKLKKLAAMIFLFPLMHLSYGVGLLWGLKKILLKPDVAKSDVNIIKVN